MIKFAMGHILITFRSKYYEYSSDEDMATTGLMIGGFKSEWLADLVAIFLLDRSHSCFCGTEFFVIYQDDGLMVFQGKKSPEKISQWLS